MNNLAPVKRNRGDEAPNITMALSRPKRHRECRFQTRDYLMQVALARFHDSGIAKYVVNQLVDGTIPSHIKKSIADQFLRMFGL